MAIILIININFYSHTMAAQEQGQGTNVTSGNLQLSLSVNGEKCDVLTDTHDGAGVIRIPDSSVSYEIELKMNNSIRKAFQINNMSVGDEVKGVKNIYFLGKHTTTGYTPGENNNFVFQSLSDREKEEGVVGPSEDTSIIKVNVTEYERIPYVEPVRYRGYDRGGGGGYDRGGGGGYDRGGGGGYDRGGVEFDADRGGSTFRSLSTASSYSGGSTFRSLSAASSYSAGGTVKGDGYVDHVKTTTTKDKFTKIQDHVFTVQLVCSASDEKKFYSNRRYKQQLLQKKQGALSTAESKLAQEQETLRILIERQQQRVNKARSECDVIRTQVAQSSEEFTSIYGEDPTHESHASIFMKFD